MHVYSADEWGRRRGRMVAWVSLTMLHCMTLSIEEAEGVEFSAHWARQDRHVSYAYASARPDWQAQACSQPVRFLRPRVRSLVRSTYQLPNLWTRYYFDKKLVSKWDYRLQELRHRSKTLPPLYYTQLMLKTSIEQLKSWTFWVGCNNVTASRQTDERPVDGCYKANVM